MLLKLTEDILSNSEHWPSDYKARQLAAVVLNSLRLDGYDYRNGKVILQNTDVINVEQAESAIECLYADLGLTGEKVTFHHLRTAEENYVAGRWGDAISNARSFLESTIQAVAEASLRSDKRTGEAAPVPKSPGDIRKYLQSRGILTAQEKDVLAANYSLFSATGSHAHVARTDEARLLMQLSLILAQFVMLRLQSGQQSAPLVVHAADAPTE